MFPTKDKTHYTIPALPGVLVVFGRTSALGRASLKRSPTMTSPTQHLTSIIDVLEYLKAHGLSQYGEIVGCWVWLEFPAKPAADVREGLSAIGFRWNRKRQVWQHPCGHHCLHSPADSWYLKAQYGAVPASTIDTDTQAA